MKLTPYQRLADTLLRDSGDNLVSWVMDQAREGVPGEVIARKLRERTDDSVDVSGQTVRNWIKQFRDGEVAA